MLDRRLRGGAPRAARAIFVALLTSTLGLVAHVAGGGLAPSAWIGVGLFVGLTPLCWALSAYRWTARPLVAVFLLAQVVTHGAAMIEFGHHSMGGPSMVLSHLAAAVVLVIAVRRGEYVLGLLVDLLLLRARRLMALWVQPSVRVPLAPSRGWFAVWHLEGPQRGRAPPTGFALS